MYQFVIHSYRYNKLAVVFKLILLYFYEGFSTFYHKIQHFSGRAVFPIRFTKLIKIKKNFKIIQINLNINFLKSKRLTKYFLDNYNLFKR